MSRAVISSNRYKFEPGRTGPLTFASFEFEVRPVDMVSSELAQMKLSQRAKKPRRLNAGGAHCNKITTGLF
jgi:hypothetical protein